MLKRTLSELTVATAFRWAVRHASPAALRDQFGQYADSIDYSAPGILNGRTALHDAVLSASPQKLDFLIEKLTAQGIERLSAALETADRFYGLTPRQMAENMLFFLNLDSSDAAVKQKAGLSLMLATLDTVQQALGERKLMDRGAKQAPIAHLQ